jgi:hypothetical protein
VQVHINRHEAELDQRCDDSLMRPQFLSRKWQFT